MRRIQHIVFVAFLMFAMNLTAQSVVLQYHFKKGDTHLIKMKMSQNMAPIMTMDLGLTMKTVTMSAKDGKFENKTTFDSVKMDMTAQGESINFDSNASDEELSEEEKKVKAELSPMLEMVLYQTLDKAGKVLDQKVLPETISGDQILNQNQLTAMVYPLTPLQVGSSWDYSQALNGAKMNVKYTVTKITGTSVFVSILGNIEGIADAEVGGEMEIDRSSGMPSDVKMDIDMGASAMGMKMLVEMTSEKL